MFTSSTEISSNSLETEENKVSKPLVARSLVVVGALFLLILSFLLGWVSRNSKEAEIKLDPSVSEVVGQNTEETAPVQETASNSATTQIPDYRAEEAKFKAERFEKMRVLSVEDISPEQSQVLPGKNVSIRPTFPWNHIAGSDTATSMTFSKASLQTLKKIKVLESFEGDNSLLFINDLMNLESERDRDTFKVEILSQDTFKLNQQDDSHCVSKHKNSYNGMYYCVMYLELPYLPGGLRDAFLDYYFWDDQGNYAQVSFTLAVSYGKITYSDKLEVLRDDQDKISVASSLRFEN